MDYQIYSISSEQALPFRNFMLPSVADSLQFPDYVFYLAVAQEGAKKIPLGILVADPVKYDPEILSIGVSRAYTGQGIGTALLKHAVEDMLSVYTPEEQEEPNRFLAAFPVSEEREQQIARVFEKAGFALAGKGSYYEVTKQMLMKSELLGQAGVKEKTEKYIKEERILPLKKVPKVKLKEFSYNLSEKEDLIPGIRPELLDEDVSILGLDAKGNINSCILFLKAETWDLQNTLVYQSHQGDISGAEVVYLLAASAMAIRQKFKSRVELSFLTTNEKAEKLIQRLFPTAKSNGKYLFYELDFEDALTLAGEERFHSEPAFGLHEISSMVCKDCRHCMKDRVLECDRYLQKPDGVLEGGDCPDFVR